MLIVPIIQGIEDRDRYLHGSSMAGRYGFLPETIAKPDIQRIITEGAFSAHGGAWWEEGGEVIGNNAEWVRGRSHAMKGTFGL